MEEKKTRLQLSNEMLDLCNKINCEECPYDYSECDTRKMTRADIAERIDGMNKFLNSEEKVKREQLIPKFNSLCKKISCNDCPYYFEDCGDTLTLAEMKERIADLTEFLEDRDGEVTGAEEADEHEKISVTGDEEKDRQAQYEYELGLELRCICKNINCTKCKFFRCECDPDKMTNDEIRQRIKELNEIFPLRDDTEDKKCLEVMAALFGDEAVKHFLMCSAYMCRYRGDKHNAERYEEYLLNF